MMFCMICRLETEADDIVLAAPDGSRVCLRCFTRETASVLPMPASLRRSLTAASAA